MKRLFTLVAAGATLAAAGAAIAPVSDATAGEPMTAPEGLVAEFNVSRAQAAAAAEAAVDACEAHGWEVAAAVVDRSGVVKALVRADGASPHTLDSSRRKAYTAAALRLSTGGAAEIARKEPGARALGEIDDFLLLGGGLPIRYKNAVVGAIGVGGAPGGDKDESCAQAGIGAIRDGLGLGSEAGG